MSRKNKERRIRNRRTKLMHADESTNSIHEVPASTPSSTWRTQGEPDPFGSQYNCERAKLTLGNLTDDQLANAVYMHDHRNLDMNAVIRGEPSSIALLTAVKERIRWLSRSLEKAQADLVELQQKMERGSLIDLQPAIDKFVASRQEYRPDGISIPEGYALVPTKHAGKAGLTDTMMRAFYDAFVANQQRGDFERLNAGYNALIDASPKSLVNPAQPQQLDIPALASRFLGWRLPKTVCSDGCVTNSQYQFPRSGTNLLNAVEAEEMLRYVLEGVKVEDVDLPVSAFQKLKTALQADSDYAWTWHCNFAMPIMDTIHCTREDANEAGAVLMKHVFDIDVKKFKVWEITQLAPAEEVPSPTDTEAKVSQPESAAVQVIDQPFDLKEIEATLQRMKPTKIYDERDRGYTKAIGHVIELLPSLLAKVPSPVAPIVDSKVAPTKLSEQDQDERHALENAINLTYEVRMALSDASPNNTDPDQFVISRKHIDTIKARLDLIDKSPVHPDSTWEIQGTLQRLLGQMMDRSEWEFETVERGRKSSAEIYPPEGEGWEPDYSRGRPGQAWDRFDYHEENYWRRRKPKA